MNLCIQHVIALLSAITMPSELSEARSHPLQQNNSFYFQYDRYYIFLMVLRIKIRNPT